MPLHLTDGDERGLDEEEGEPEGEDCSVQDDHPTEERDGAFAEREVGRAKAEQDGGDHEQSHAAEEDAFASAIDWADGGARDGGARDGGGCSHEASLESGRIWGVVAIVRDLLGSKWILREVKKALRWRIGLGFGG